MPDPELSRHDRLNLENTFEQDDTFVNRLWNELAGTNSELQILINHEALRLFPADTVSRARATRLVMEIVQAIHVAELGEIVHGLTSDESGGEVRLS